MLFGQNVQMNEIVRPSYSAMHFTEQLVTCLRTFLLSNIIKVRRKFKRSKLYSTWVIVCARWLFRFKSFYL